MSLLRRSSTLALTSAFAVSVVFTSAAAAAHPAATTEAAPSATAIDTAEERVIELIN